MPEPPPSTPSLQPHPADPETTNRSPPAFKALARDGCYGAARLAFTGYRESLRRSLSHGLSRRGRAPQSAHSGLRKESVAFISFFSGGFYVRPFLWPYEPDADMPQSGVFPRLTFTHIQSRIHTLQLLMKEIPA